MVLYDMSCLGVIEQTAGVQCVPLVVPRHVVFNVAVSLWSKAAAPSDDE